MQNNSLKPKTPSKRSRQIGRGGKRGKTAGRGTKGQNARAGHKKRPELRDFIKRLPKLRGRGVSSLKPYRAKPLALNLDRINALYKGGEVVSSKTVAAKLGLKSVQPVKVLANGELDKKLSFEGVAASAEARKKIAAAGGDLR